MGVVGFPNVGKSSLINSLKRSKVANVGATPGVTRSMQEIQLDKNVKLLDCPGIVFSTAVGDQAAAALRNAVKVEKLEDPILPGMLGTPSYAPPSSWYLSSTAAQLWHRPPLTIGAGVEKRGMSPFVRTISS